MNVPKGFKKFSEEKTEQLLDGPKIREDEEDCPEYVERVYPKNLDNLTYTWRQTPVRGEDFDSLSKLIERDHTYMVRVNELRGPWFTKLTYYLEGGDVWVYLPWEKSWNTPVKVCVYGRPQISKVKETTKELSKGAEEIVEKLNQKFLAYLKKE